eukprot:11221752-Lingulodinium_polyedra.AAC.1
MRTVSSDAEVVSPSCSALVLGGCVECSHSNWLFDLGLRLAGCPRPGPEALAFGLDERPRPHALATGSSSGTEVASHCEAGVASLPSVSEAVG